MWRKLLDALPHGHYLAEEDWRRRHRLMLWILGLHVPAALGLASRAWRLHRPPGPPSRHRPAGPPGPARPLSEPSPCLVVSGRHGRGWRFCSIGTLGARSPAADIFEAHFHFFIIIGFIALYQDWVLFWCNVAFARPSATASAIDLTCWAKIFNHPAAQAHPAGRAGRSCTVLPRRSRAPGWRSSGGSPRTRQVRQREAAVLPAHHRGCVDRAPEGVLTSEDAGGRPCAASREPAVGPLLVHHHFALSKQGAGPGRAGSPVPARPPRHPRAAQRREPARARR